MRLQPAIALDDYQEDRVSGFGDRESRRERRAARQERREQRRENRQERKTDRRVERVQRKRQKVRQKLGPVARAPMQAAPTLQPAPMTLAPPQPQRKAGQLVERAVEWVDEYLDEDEPLDEELEDQATQGIGALEAWGPVVRMGRRLRIQAAVGHRAAVIELKPGLYLVADLPEAVTRTQFGLAPLLAPMMMRAARRSMDEPGEERRGPFSRLFRRRQREEPIRYVAVVQQEPAAAQAQLALPGPTEDGTMLVAAPNVGWADDATVAAVYGCDACERGRR